MGYRIIVADDEAEIRELLRLYLEKEGYEVSTKDFMRIGVPFTLVAVLSGYIVNWIFWS